MEYVQRAQATTGKVGSVPFWEKDNAQGANPPAGHVAVAPLPAPIPLAPHSPQTGVITPPAANVPLAPPQAAPVTVTPPVHSHNQFEQYPIVPAPPVPALPTDVYQPNSTDIMFTQTIDTFPSAPLLPSGNEGKQGKITNSITSLCSQVVGKLERFNISLK